MFHYGAFRTCPVCQKQFFVADLGGWAYKRYLSRTKKNPNAKNELTWFCTWSCLRKWDAEHEDKRRKKKELDWEE